MAATMVTGMEICRFLVYQDWEEPDGLIFHVPREQSTFVETHFRRIQETTSSAITTDTRSSITWSR